MYFFPGEHLGGEKDDPFVMDTSQLPLYGGGTLFFNNFNVPGYGAVDENIVRDYVRKQM